MTRLSSLAILAAGILAGAAGSYWYVHRPEPMSMTATEQAEPANGERKILYYRNPMGLPDTSKVPKKDSMGMDYIPVYADEAADDAVSISPGKVQRSGVKTETVGKKSIARTVRGVGLVEHDESRLWTVTVRSDGYVENLFVNKTGQRVVEGDPLFRFYSPQIQLAQVDLLVAKRGQGGRNASRDLDGAMQRLRNLGVPESRIEEVLETEANPRTIDWASPATGHVIRKNVIEGQRVMAGDELFRIGNHERVWVIAQLAESDIGDIAVGTPVTVTLRAFPNRPHQGEVTFIYPEMMKPETRTLSVRVELPNPELRLKPGMYADVVFHPETEEAPVAAVPASAVIDSGTRKIVLVATGEGRFEPREVKIGRTGDGYVEVLEGVKPGEDVVTAATFLIDSESNLKAALQSLEHRDAVP
jgi:membrane fusion protein, copper/silver efflux system